MTFIRQTMRPLAAAVLVLALTALPSTTTGYEVVKRGGDEQISPVGVRGSQGLKLLEQLKITVYSDSGDPAMSLPAFLWTSDPVDFIDRYDGLTPYVEDQNADAGDIGFAAWTGWYVGTLRLYGTTAGGDVGEAVGHVNFTVFQTADCLAGYHLEGAAGCQPCEPGSALNDGLNSTAPCQLCPVGTHAPGPGMPLCIPCPGNTHSTDVGTVRCFPCPAGTELLKPGDISCTRVTAPAAPFPWAWTIAGIVAVGSVVAGFLLWRPRDHVHSDNIKLPKPQQELTEI